MSTRESTSVSELGDRIAGEVVLPGHSDYDQARTVWNATADKRPAAVARVRSTADVVEVVNFARERGLELSVRGGGHSLPGFSTNDGGIVLDLSAMNAVTVDQDSRTATVEGGATWAQFDAATHAYGLATTGGLISSTGVGGLTLGGGIGWLVRLCGLSCDNLLSAELVLADGSIVQAGAGQNLDLLWALRGGGGNFGVVTRFEFRLHPVREILASILMFPESRATEVLRAYRDWVRDLPDELSTIAAFTTAPPEEFVPESLQMQRVIAIIGSDAGNPEEGERLLDPILALDPPARMIAPMPYPMFQSMLDASAPPGRRNHFKGAYLDELSDAAIELLVTQAAARPSDLCELDIHHMGGAFARVGEDDTAFSNRSLQFALNIIAIWEDPALDQAHRNWARATASALEPVASQGTYVNFLTDQSPELVREAYGSKYQRLVDLKRRYDPSNLFHLNQNIRP